MLFNIVRSFSGSSLAYLAIIQFELSDAKERAFLFCQHFFYNGLNVLSTDYSAERVAMSHLGRLLLHYRFILLITLLLWALVGWQLGLAALAITVILSILEITLSADNAVVNSRVLVKMSPFWQRLFLTVGIFIAVFVVRFALPIAVVAMMSPLSTADVLDLAFNDANRYSDYLKDISPIIEAFGGMFLLLVSLFFFMDTGRKNLWIRPLEWLLTRAGQVSSLKYMVAIAVAVAVLLAVEPEMQRVTALALGAGLLTYLVLHTIAVVMEHLNQKNQLKKQVGWAAFASFLYLEVLDASFSLDGVVGAFALTNNIIIIMVGLGIGALWVRTITIYMVRHKTLLTYKYLESGAHWAIVCLALVMFLKLVHIEIPEIMIGLIGLFFIAAAIFSSYRVQRQEKRR